MSFTLQLGTNHSEKIKADKNVTYTHTLTGSLKNESDVVDPTILVEGLPDIDKIDYMSIPEFGRFYFVTVRLIRENLFEITGHTDVISSFKSEIRANEAIIKKQESKFNLYLDDGSFKAYQNPKYGVLNFSGGTGFGVDSQSSSYILAVAGG